MGDTMNAVVFHGPRKVAVEKRPIPKIQHPKDIVVRVQYTALCGRSVSSLLLDSFLSYTLLIRSVVTSIYFADTSLAHQAQ